LSDSNGTFQTKPRNLLFWPKIARFVAPRTTTFYENPEIFYGFLARFTTGGPVDFYAASRR